MKAPNLHYKIVLRELEEQDGGGWEAEVPDLPGCIVFGETKDLALASVVEERDGWIEDQLALGRSLPLPTREDGADYSGRITFRVPRSLHRKLAQTADGERVSLNQYLLNLISESHVRHGSST